MDPARGTRDDPHQQPVALGSFAEDRGCPGKYREDSVFGRGSGPQVDAFARDEVGVFLFPNRLRFEQCEFCNATLTVDKEECGTGVVSLDLDICLAQLLLRFLDLIHPPRSLFNRALGKDPRFGQGAHRVGSGQASPQPGLDLDQRFLGPSQIVAQATDFEAQSFGAIGFRSVINDRIRVLRI